MGFIAFAFDWCDGVNGGVSPILHLIKTVINVLRVVVPIALIMMTSMDIVKKVINPDDKDGQKKIMTRAIAALIVFLVPTIINFALWVIDKANGTNVGKQNTGLVKCWEDA